MSSPCPHECKCPIRSRGPKLSTELDFNVVLAFLEVHLSLHSSFTSAMPELTHFKPNSCSRPLRRQDHF